MRSISRAPVVIPSEGLCAVAVVDESHLLPALAVGNGLQVKIRCAPHAIDWSPDGNEVAIFAGMRTYLVSADASDRWWLVDQSWFASWSPDGPRLAVRVLGPTIDTPDGRKRSRLGRARLPKLVQLSP